MTKRNIARQNVDDQKWSSILAYVHAYLEWEETSKRLGGFDPISQSAWDEVKRRRKVLDRMVKL